MDSNASMQLLTDIGDRILAFITKRFPQARKSKLGETDPLLGSGIIDSLGVLEVVAFIEKEFSITVTDDELSPDNFGTLAALTEFVKRKSASPTAG